METGQRRKQKSTCYFCQEILKNDDELVGHMSVCGKVLDSCPYKCGAYIKREDLEEHKNECTNRTVNTVPRTTLPKATQYQNSNNTLDKAVKVQNNQKEEIYKLSRRMADLESRLLFFITQNQPQIIISKFENLKNVQIIEIEKLKAQNEATFKWRTNSEILLQQIKQNITSLNISRQNMDSNLLRLQSGLAVLKDLENQIYNLKDSFLREQAYNRQVEMNFNDSVEVIKKQQAQENAQNLAILSDVKDSVNSIKGDLENVVSDLKDQTIKVNSIVYDLGTARGNITDADKVIKKLQENFETMRTELNQIKLDMEILEGLSSSSDMKHTPGRLLWQITEVDTKMVQAKQSGNVLKSPIFFTHEYGYRIRILLYLNGLNKWKDRFALLSIQILKGEYDVILKWPSQIEGTVTLRDLENIDKPKIFTKTITAKRQCGGEECEDPQESSSSYIFIPHNTLLKVPYLKDDTLYFDIKIRQNVKLETNL